MDVVATFQQYGYYAIFVAPLIEGETALLLSGWAAFQGYFKLPWVMVAAALGGFANDQLGFALGRRYGDRLLARFPSLAPRAARATDLLDRYRTPVILSVRFLYGLRIAAPIAIGMSRVTWWRFALLDAVSAAVWASLFCALGFWLGNALQPLLADLRAGFPWVLAGAVALGLAVWGWRRARSG